MKKAYPIFIKQSGKDFLVYVPDMDIYTEGKSVENAIEMAEDAIGLKGIDIEDSGLHLPEPSTYENALVLAKKEADGDFDFSDGIQTLVNVDFVEYRKRLDSTLVKKNCTIPNYINKEAEKKGFNFSKILQEALLEKLGWAIPPCSAAAF